MRRQTRWLGIVVAFLFLLGAGLVGSCRQNGEPAHSSAGERLLPAAPGEPAVPGTIVYVPVYSSLEIGVGAKGRSVDLAATVSVRNTSSVHPITLRWVRYYDSFGRKIRDYLDRPSVLPPLGSVEFVVQRADTAGGPGANFLIRWDGPANVDEPLMEAVMFSQNVNAGVSFTSRGQVVKTAPPE